MSYIEREALLLQIDLHGTNRFGMLDEDVREFIKKQPAADVVEVVRCSECKYFGRELKQGKHSCLNYQLPYCLENDYCSYGERQAE